MFKWLNKIRLKGLPTKTDTNVLVVDDNGDIGINTSTAGDITSVIGGTNCTVSGGTSGDATVNVDDSFLVNDASDTTTGTITADGFTTTGTWTFDESSDGTVGITTVQNSGTSFSDNDTSLMTSAAIADKVEDYGYGDITGVRFTTDDSNSVSDTSGSADFTIEGGLGINTTIPDGSTITISGSNASTSAKGIVELATTAETTTGTDTDRAVTAVGVTAVHATVQNGKNYRIINTSFRDDIQTTKHYLPLKSQAEQTSLTREEATELAVCDGRLVSATVRVENMGGTTGDFTLTMGVETNIVDLSYANFEGTSETVALTVNTDSDQHVFHFVFSTDPHWSATDMFAISIQSSSDEWGTSERFFVTLVIEDDWSTYLAGVSREIDTTP